MKSTIVAEIGSNWEGSITTAKKLILECKKAGADAVKFQMWRAKDLYDVSHPNWNDIKKSELEFNKVDKIKKYRDQITILTSENAKLNSLVCEMEEKLDRYEQKSN